MRKKFLFLSLIIISVAFFASLVYAQENEMSSTLPVAEMMKCVFANADIEQKCYTADGLYSCSGFGVCTTEVSGNQGDGVAWKSSCGSYAYTTIDGQNESAEFDCATPIVEQVKCVFEGSQTQQKCYTVANNIIGCSGVEACVVDVKGMKGDSITWKSSCGGLAYTKIDGQNKYAVFDCATPVSEQVKCVFKGSQTEQKCYAAVANNVGFGCSGQEACVVDVKGIKGEKITWKSSCGGYAYTTMDGLGEYDGRGEYAVFDCSAVTPSITVISPNGGEKWILGSSQVVKWTSVNISENHNIMTVRLKDLAGAEYNLLSDTPNDGYENIVIPAALAPGLYSLEMKSVIDNQTVFDSSNAQFKIVAADLFVSEQVACIFKGSQTEQKCYAAVANSVGFGCSGQEACVVDVKGIKGEKVTWKSSCGGYAYTEIDGDDETAVFDCTSAIIDINNNAKDIYNNNYENILFELKRLRNIIIEQQNRIKYLESIAKDLENISEKMKNIINDFITYGVDSNTVKLGAGERAAVVNSYKAAFAKLPETEAELADVIKIANGRFPTVVSDKAEQQAKERFIKIYKRIVDLNNSKDNAAIKIMAYGLRQKAENRNLNSEKFGIKAFKAIYGYMPKTAEDWNAMQAITYSGATREKDSDGDLLSDEMEAQYDTNPNKADTDGDGFRDGEEVNRGFNPKGEGKL